MKEKMYLVEVLINGGGIFPGFFSWRGQLVDGGDGDCISFPFFLFLFFFLVVFLFAWLPVFLFVSVAGF